MRLAVVVLAAVALAVAGCGGGSDEEAADLLKRGFASDVDSGVLTLEAEFQARGVAGFGGPFKLELEGPFRAAPSPTEMPDLDVDFTASGAGQTVSGHVITTRENAWVEYEGETYEVGEDVWVRLLEGLQQQSRDRPETLGDAGIDPLEWVEDAETAGEEDIGGTQATKVTGKLDVEAMLRDVNRIATERLPESTIRDSEDVVEDIDFGAWIAEDDIWRRVTAETDFEIPEDERDSLGGLDSGHVSLDVKLEEPNEPVQIEGPAEAHSIDQLLEQMGIPPESLLGPGYSPSQPG